MTTETQAVDAEPRDFAAFLLEHAKGKSHDELSQALRDLVLAVEETGKSGKITYVVTVKPQERVDGAVIVSDKITCALPELDRPQSLFFATDNGELVRHDPRQLSILDEGKS